MPVAPSADVRADRSGGRHSCGRRPSIVSTLQQRADAPCPLRRRAQAVPPRQRPGISVDAHRLRSTARLGAFYSPSSIPVCCSAGGRRSAMCRSMPAVSAQVWRTWPSARCCSVPWAAVRTSTVSSESLDGDGVAVGPPLPRVEGGRGPLEVGESTGDGVELGGQVVVTEVGASLVDVGEAAR